jgi:hypothetical protein
MADKIDKTLPNVTETVHVESPEEIEIEESQKLQEITDEGVEITKNEDGSADVEFEPGKVAMSGSEDHFSNLADLLPDIATLPGSNSTSALPSSFLVISTPSSVIS